MKEVRTLIHSFDLSLEVISISTSKEEVANRLNKMLDKLVKYFAQSASISLSLVILRFLKHLLIQLSMHLTLKYFQIDFTLKCGISKTFT